MSASHNELARELQEVEDERDALLSILAGIEAINQETIPGDVVLRLDMAMLLPVPDEGRALR